MKNRIIANSVFPVIAAMAFPSFAQAGTSMAPVTQSDCAEGWTLGLEALALRPFAGESNGEDGYDFGGRASLGYQFGDCFFTQVNYFGYSGDTLNQRGLIDTTDPISDYFTDNHNLEVNAVDWVFGQHFKPTEKMKLSPYAGLRWTTVNQSYNYSRDSVVDAPFYSYREHGDAADFSGLGIVVGLDATRSLGNDFSLYGTVKQSVVFGSSDSHWHSTTIEGDADPVVDSSSDSQDIVMSISELGFGLQYDFALSGAAANIRGGFDGQWWGGLNNADGADFGLAGFSLAANFRF
jgi:hypothetical protein